MRAVADGWRWLKIWDRVCGGDRKEISTAAASVGRLATQRHVCCDPVDELDAGTVAGDVEVYAEDDAVDGAGGAGGPDWRADARWLSGVCGRLLVKCW